jgi:hypothetical protein
VSLSKETEAMSATQFFIMLGTIYIAPHVGGGEGRIIGISFIALGIFMELFK